MRKGLHLWCLWWRGIGWVGKEGECPKWPLNLTLTQGMGNGKGERNLRYPKLGSPHILMWILHLVTCDDSEILRMKSSRVAFAGEGGGRGR